MIQATYEDAALIMKLYDLRREERLRKARDWFRKEFQAKTVQEQTGKNPRGSEQEFFLGMVLGYWEMAASFLMRGIVHEELFFENCGELFAVWEKAKPLIEEYRRQMKNPLIGKNMEKAMEKYVAWLDRNAPGACEAMRSMISGQS